MGQVFVMIEMGVCSKEVGQLGLERLADFTDEMTVLGC